MMFSKIFNRHVVDFTVEEFLKILEKEQYIFRGKDVNNFCRINKISDRRYSENERSTPVVRLYFFREANKTKFLLKYKV